MVRLLFICTIYLRSSLVISGVTSPLYSRVAFLLVTRDICWVKSLCLVEFG